MIPVTVTEAEVGLAGQSKQGYLVENGVDPPPRHVQFNIARILVAAGIDDRLEFYTDMLRRLKTELLQKRQKRRIKIGAFRLEIIQLFVREGDVGEFWRIVSLYLGFVQSLTDAL